MNLSEPFIRRPGRDFAHHGGAGAARESSRSRSCRWRRCRRSISRPSASPARSPARAPRPWHPRSPRRWSASSARFPGVTQLTSTSALGATNVVIQFDLNRNIDARRPGCAGGDHGCEQVPAPADDLSADLPEGQSGRRADHDAVGAFRYLAAHHRPRLLDNLFIQALSQVPGVAQASIYRRPEAVDPHPGRSDEACRASG